MNVGTISKAGRRMLADDPEMLSQTYICCESHLNVGYVSRETLCTVWHC